MMRILTSIVLLGILVSGCVSLEQVTNGAFVLDGMSYRREQAEFGGGAGVLAYRLENPQNVSFFVSYSATAVPSGVDPLHILLFSGNEVEVVQALYESDEGGEPIEVGAGPLHLEILDPAPHAAVPLRGVQVHHTDQTDAVLIIAWPESTGLGSITFGWTEETEVTPIPLDPWRLEVHDLRTMRQGAHASSPLAAAHIDHRISAGGEEAAVVGILQMTESLAGAAEVAVKDGQGERRTDPTQPARLQTTRTIFTSGSEVSVTVTAVGSLPPRIHLLTLTMPPNIVEEQVWHTRIEH